MIQVRNRDRSRVLNFYINDLQSDVSDGKMMMVASVKGMTVAGSTVKLITAVRLFMAKMI